MGSDLSENLSLHSNARNLFNATYESSESQFKYWSIPTLSRLLRFLHHLEAAEQATTNHSNRKSKSTTRFDNPKITARQIPRGLNLAQRQALICMIRWAIWLMLNFCVFC